MRGKDHERGERSMAVRITPACAGKRPTEKGAVTMSWDHPRVCGEKCVTSRSLRRFWGSPPRVRGKAPLVRLTKSPPGITPACAGKRFCEVHNVVMQKDHPRVCGEKLHCRLGSGCFPGSPPRVRGKDRLPAAGRACSGITPACAGKRGAAEASSSQRGDHPRVCGEKTKKIP